MISKSGRKYPINRPTSLRKKMIRSRFECGSQHGSEMTGRGFDLRRGTRVRAVLEGEVAAVAEPGPTIQE